MKKTKVALFLSTCLLSQAYAKDITLMVLGPTGAGKSTLMNAIYMHATQETFDPANAKFIIELNSSSQEPTPPRLNGALNPEYFAGAQAVGQTLYANLEGQIQDAEDNAAPSQTRRLTGYTFTPQLAGWSPDDRLQLLDTPGLDDTASCQYDNRSAHILIAQAIEKHLKQYPDQLTAIALVLPVSLTRECPSTKQLLNTIRTFFPAQVLERLYIFINHAKPKTKMPPPAIATIINRNIKYEGSTVSAAHYKKVDPLYIAQFNCFLDSENPDTPPTYQAYIDLTQGTIQAFLDEVRQFKQPIAIKAYADFTTKKNQLAQHLSDAIKIKLQIEEKTKEQVALQEKLDFETTICNELEKRKKKQVVRGMMTTEYVKSNEIEMITKTVKDKRWVKGTTEVDNLNPKGLASGGVAGLAIGSAVPVIGTVIGGIAGAVTGGIVDLFMSKKEVPDWKQEEYEKEITCPQIKPVDKPIRVREQYVEEVDNPEVLAQLQQKKAEQESLNKECAGLESEIKQKDEDYLNDIAAMRVLLRDMFEVEYATSMLASEEGLATALKETLHSVHPELFKRSDQIETITTYLQEIVQKVYQNLSDEAAIELYQPSEAEPIPAG